MQEQKSPITTSGPLFEAVQRARVFEDSKYFVDCRPKTAPEHIIEKWGKQKDERDFSLRHFVEANFYPPDGDEDAAGKLPQTDNCRDHIRQLWPLLFREAETGGSTPRYDSLLPLPHPYVVPGGRFREIYYWDSYFTALGLVSDGHAEMLLNMTRNFAHLIETQGHVPNGNRAYYLSRSQPPFFALMVELCGQHFGTKIIPEFIPALRKEYDFWSDKPGESNRRRIGIKHLIANQEEGKAAGSIPLEGYLNRYWDDHPMPREESWHEDFNLAQELPEQKRRQLYRNIRAACESGWDFTSRWLSDGKKLLSIETTHILPVDLNVLLWNLEQKLAEWLPEEQAAEKQDFARKARQRQTLIQALCWNEKTGFFHDVQLQALQPSPQLSLAGVFPLFMGMATQAQAERVAARLRKDFLKEGGLVSTPVETGQQWDAPNGWAPLQWLAYCGLKRYGLDELAGEIRHRWLRCNDIIFERHHKMVEKYDVVHPSGHAGGGEYPLQDGFGWSNGVYAALFDDA